MTTYDMSEVFGHEHVKRALEVAAAGAHTIALIGPPGCGKTMLAQRMSAIQDGDKFSLVYEHRPCPCGFYGDTSTPCICAKESRIAHFASTKALEADITIEVPRLKSDEIMRYFFSDKPSFAEKSERIRARVIAAREAQRRRGTGYNSMSSPFDPGFVRGDIRDLCRAAVVQLQLTPREVCQAMQLTRTIADLDGKDEIQLAHLAEAVQYKVAHKKYYDAA